MTKEDLIYLIKEYGDATITYRSQNSKKLKYNVCTLDFDNEYIKTKINKAEETENSVLMFCWDADAFRLLNPSSITSVVPLSSTLKEKKGNGK